MTKTNRDFYLLVTGFEEKYKTTLPSLEEYLRSLWKIVSLANATSPTPDDIANWLESAFTTEPPPFMPEWSTLTRNFKTENSSFSDWEKVILYQIVDLRQMAENGQLDDEYQYFGIQSPSGYSWYNFDPLTYLECGVQGTLDWYKKYGGSEDNPIQVISHSIWDWFIHILVCGQIYE